MSARTGRGWTGSLALLAAILAAPGVVAGQPIGASTVVESSPLARALGSFLLVGAAGGALLTWSPALVDRAVDDTMERPSYAVAYGLFAFILVLFAGFYANDLLGRAGLATTPVGYLALAIIVGGVLSVGGLGFLVVGTLLMDLFVGRRPWQGLVLGAALSAVGWLALPLAGAVATWILVAAIGVGGRTRTWVNSERTVPPDLES